MSGNNIKDEYDDLFYRDSNTISNELYYKTPIRNVHQFIDEFVEYKARYKKTECYPGLMSYKSEKFPIQKINISGKIHDQQVLVSNVLSNIRVYDRSELTTTCGEVWCCNPKHLVKAKKTNAEEHEAKKNE